MSNMRSCTEFKSSGKKRRRGVGVVTLLLTCCLIAPPSGAAQNAGQEGRDVEIGGSKVTIPDLLLTDQEGRKVHFYSDLIKDKVVVLNFFYTSCVYTCTRQGKVLSDLQSLLGERMGKSVFLISVTTDPSVDTPERLKKWAARYNVRPGWALITGEEAEMNKLLEQFTGGGTGGGTHLPSIFIGNDRSGVWTSAAGAFAPEVLLKVVNHISAEGSAK
jgi:cytochrome oxidase Cu insertion factor (SCO1/SenC/PrrC family)